MVGFGPLTVVDGPRPQARRFGLLTAATIVPTDDDYWINGVAVRPYPSGDAQGFDPCDDSGTSPNTKTTGGAITEGDFGALTVYFAETCTARGLVLGGENDDAEFRQRAIIAAAPREEKRVSNEFWTGTTLPSTPHLTDANATLLNGGAITNKENGLSLLEQAIANTGVAGMIHASAAMISAWSDTYAIMREGNQIVTALGTIVVAGAGYNGSAPSGGAAASGTVEWAFATGPVEVRRSDLFLVPGTLAEALDRTHNIVTYRAERYYVTTWDRTLQAAVRIDRCQVACAT